ncbi:armadillo-type protein [Mycotypha africana]|uniref:armadillo-type protein n=1 Tax=Mycotypha africana TaxID=64632 RepID=UPI0023017BBB|nr:armadillo-type protein [Mycotypha africana]KAI8975059.1 armadillo-type protein [Mycotypha africana]
MTASFVTSCTECLIRHYLILTSEDIEQWQEDPEGWLTEAEADQWEFELRPCAEKTFTTLLYHYRDLLLPLLLHFVDQAVVLDRQDPQAFFFKEAVYSAIGLGVKTLYGHFDFERFVMTYLVKDLDRPAGPPPMIKRRIAWTLGKWASESISEECRKVAFDVLLQWMAAPPSEEKEQEQQGQQRVVQLTAAHALTQAVDNWEFDIQLFLPYLGSTLTHLLHLLSQAEAPETVLSLVTDVKAILMRTGTEILPFASDIIQMLLPCWQPTREPLLLSSLIDTFRHVVAEAHVYLLEDALDLWWTLLQTAPMNSPEFMSLYYPPALALLDYDTENLRKVLKVIESYLLLDPSSTLAPPYQPILFEKLASKVKDTTRGPVAHYVSHTLDLVLQSAPLSVYGQALVDSDVLTNILELLMKEDKSQAMATYMNVFARLAFLDANFVMRILQTKTQPQQPQDEVISRVLDRWLDNVSFLLMEKKKKKGKKKLMVFFFFFYKLDYLDAQKKRVACVGLTHLLLSSSSSHSSGDDVVKAVVMNKLPNIMAVWMDAGFDR